MSQHSQPEHDGLHADTARHLELPARGDYPARLLTRRTLSQSTDAILRAREHAPGALPGLYRSGRVHHRPA